MGRTKSALLEPSVVRISHVGHAEQGDTLLDHEGNALGQILIQESLPTGPPVLRSAKAATPSGKPSRTTKSHSMDAASHCGHALSSADIPASGGHRMHALSQQGHAPTSNDLHSEEALTLTHQPDQLRPSECTISQSAASTRALVQSCHAADWQKLRFAASMLEDVQTSRIGIGNRMWAGETMKVLDPGVMGNLRGSFEKLEDEFRKALVFTYREVVPPEIKEWQKKQKGIGEPTLAWILGLTGDPFIASPMFTTDSPPSDHECDPFHCKKKDGKQLHLVAGEPYYRTLSQFWQYCGLGDASRRPAKGMTQAEMLSMGKPQIKVLMHRVLGNVIKGRRFGGEYVELYDHTKANYAGKIHTAECKRCGPSGKPAQIGSPWSPGHIDAGAKRYVAKEILRDLYMVRRAAVLASL